MARVLAILSLFFAATLAAHICEVVLDSFTDATPSITLKGSAYDLTGDHFNVISYDGFSAPSGDIEGRAAVKNAVSVSQYSFGYELQTKGPTANDIHLPYSLVAGGDVTWNGGAPYPLGSGYPYAGDQEKAYVGGAFTTSTSYMNDYVDANQGNKDAAFASSLAYYSRLQDAFAAVSPNINVNKVYNALQIICPSLTVTSYTADVDAALLSSATEWDLRSCNPDAQFVFNVRGSGGVTFAGNNGITGAKNQRVLFNIIATGTVTIQTEVQGQILAPRNNYNQAGQGVVKGQVVVANVQQVHQINLIRCVVPTPVAVVEPCNSFETDCAGLNVQSLSSTPFSLRDFNAIVFNDFTTDTGDVEGRLYVGGNFVAGNGYSVGYELNTANNAPDRSLPFSLIVGGDLTWGSGSLHPDGTGYPHGGNGEFGLVGGDNATTASIQARLQKGDATAIKNEIAEAKTCYTGYSSVAAAKADNTVSKVAYSGLFVTCNNPAETNYVLSVTDAQLASITYYSVSGCNFQANWVINVRGTGDVVFSGDNFPGIQGAILYNVIGARNINIKETAFRAHLLAPESNLALTSASWGKIVVNQVTVASQFNKANTCHDISTVMIPIVASAAAQQGSNQVTIFSVSSVQVGDLTQYGPITAINGDTITLSQGLSQPVSAGSIVTYAQVPSNSGRGAEPSRSTDSSTTTTSSATTVRIALAAVFVAALVI